MKNFPIIMVASLGLFLMGCQTIQNTPNTDENTTGEVITGTQEATGISIQSFEDCLNAGFPIMESYPRQCNDGTTTYTEEISQNLSGQESSGETTSQITSETTGNKTPESTGTDLTQLQQRLKAMMERRNQTTTSNTTTQNTTTNDKVTEEDIANLEKVIDQIIKK